MTRCFKRLNARRCRAKTELQAAKMRKGPQGASSHFDSNGALEGQKSRIHRLLNTDVHRDQALIGSRITIDEQEVLGTRAELLVA